MGQIHGQEWVPRNCHQTSNCPVQLMQVLVLLKYVYIYMGDRMFMNGLTYDFQVEVDFVCGPYL